MESNQEIMFKRRSCSYCRVHIHMDLFDEWLCKLITHNFEQDILSLSVQTVYCQIYYDGMLGKKR